MREEFEARQGGSERTVALAKIPGRKYTIVKSGHHR
jgi:hypothetical protein